MSEEKGEIKDIRVSWAEPKRASLIKGLSFDERKTRVNHVEICERRVLGREGTACSKT